MSVLSESQNDVVPQSSTHLKRATTSKLRQIFERYASFKKNGDIYMTSEDFIRKFLGLYTDDNFNLESVKLLAGIADTSKDGLISFAEFQAFEGLLCSPDALYRTAFQLFDRKGNGSISYDDFAEIVKKTELFSKIPIDLDGTFIKECFGKKKDRSINYPEFTRILYDFHEEYALEAFRSKDPHGTGYISPMDFQAIMTQVKRHLLTTDVKDNLVAVTEGHKVSFPYFKAFISLINNMELMKRIYLQASRGSLSEALTKDEFLYTAQTTSQTTPMEVDILFRLICSVNQTGRLIYDDLKQLCPEPPMKIIAYETKGAPKSQSAGMQALENMYRFTLGSIAGGVGATVVYPIDLVKTRMQNQRTGSVIGEVAYRNSFDCFKKVIRHEGFGGLYRGLLPQLIGVAPEKAIKLTVNDFVRDKFTDKNGHIPYIGEVLAGASAGTCQVVFTNPLEIVKIRLQVAGEIAGGQKIRALNVVRELGIMGLYKGARACLLRDIPFSAIYFPVYSHTKSSLANADGYNNPLSLLAAGAIAGIPAASLVTPADVIKTRLQVSARKGQTQYKGIIDAATKIMREEGPRAFWKGAGARVIRSSPQFGITLVTYELLHRFFHVDFGGSTRAGSASHSGRVDHQKNPDHIGGYQLAVPLLNGIESKFGLCLPRFSKS